MATDLSNALYELYKNMFYRRIVSHTDDLVVLKL